MANSAFSQSPNVVLTPKNALINGAFEVWQRGTSFAAIANGAYSADRWIYGKAGAAAHTISRSTDVPTVAQAGALAPYSLLIDCTTADASLAATDQTNFTQRIEGYVWRAYAQRQLTLSFWVKATKTGTYCIALLNSGADRHFVAEYTVSVTDTWENKTISIPASPSAGTWDYTTGIGAQVVWTLANGSTNGVGTAGSWQSGTYNLCTTNQVNATDDAANNFRLALVQLEAGSVATPFENVPFGVELARCQRYFYTMAAGAAALNIANGNYLSTTNVRGVLWHPTTMRVAPTLVVATVGNIYVQSLGNANNAASAIAALQAHVDNVLLSVTVTAATAGEGATILTTADPGLTLTAEL